MCSPSPIATLDVEMKSENVLVGGKGTYLVYWRSKNKSSSLSQVARLIGAFVMAALILATSLDEGDFSSNLTRWALEMNQGIQDEVQSSLHASKM